MGIMLSKAISDLDKRNNADIYFNAGEDYFYARNGKIENYPKAYVHYKVTLNLNPKHASSLVRIEWLHKQPQILLCGAEGWNRLGEEYICAKDYFLARVCYEKSIELNIKHINSLYSLGILFERGYGVLKNLEKAKEFYAKAAQEDHYDSKKYLLIINHSGLKTAEEWFTLGQDYHRGNERKSISQDNTLAQASLEHAISLDPKHPGSLHVLGFIHELGLGGEKTIDFEKAKRYYKDAEQTDNKHWSYRSKLRLLIITNPQLKTDSQWERLGDEYYYGKDRAQDKIRARACYEQAIKLNNRNKLTWNKKGLTSYEENDYSSAIKCFDSAIKIDPTNKILLYNCGMAFSGSGNYTEAIRFFDRALAIDSKYAIAWQQKAIAHCFQGEYANEDKCYGQILQIDPKYIPADILPKKIMQFFQEQPFDLEQIGNPLNKKLLMIVTAKLLGESEDTCRELWDKNKGYAIKYSAHLASKEGKKTIRNHELIEINLEGAHPTYYLPMRINVFINLFFDLYHRIIPDYKLPVQKTKSTLSHQRYRLLRLLADEILADVELHNNVKVQTDLLRDKLVARIAELKNGEELLYYNGYTNSEAGHAIYMSWLCYKNYIIVRVDNLGDGCLEYHKNQKKEGYAHRLQSHIVGCFKKRDFEEKNPALLAYIQDVAKARFMERDESLKIIYNKDDKYQIHGLSSKKLVAEIVKSLPFIKIQDVGNCAVKNRHPAFRMRALRLDESDGLVLYKYIKEYEVSMVAQRAKRGNAAENSVTFFAKSTIDNGSSLTSNETKNSYCRLM